MFCRFVLNKYNHMASMWGEVFDKKEEHFDEAIQVIEEKYVDILKDEVDRISGEKPDHLNNHFGVIHDSHRIELVFPKDSYLLNYIQEEIKEAFTLHFSAK